MEPVRKKVNEKLALIFDEKTLDASRLADHIETCIFNWTIKTCKIRRIPCYWKEPGFRYTYCMKALGVMFNLKNPANPGLLPKVTGGSIGPKKLVNAHPSELFPEKWDVLYERVAEKQLRKQLTTDLDSVPDGFHTCSKCKSKKTTYTQLQTRSADEPMTTFIACLSCGKRWKF